MSKLDVTTQELFLRLGPTAQSRRARAEALFRRLRLESQDQIADALMRAPGAMNAGQIVDKEGKATKRARKTRSI
ncbi:MAG: hypothetical protein AAFW81_06295 [Pseudomonadota bacterium]